MLLFLAELLTHFQSAFNVFGYLTLRMILGTLTALFLSLWMGPQMIRRLVERQIGQAVRDDGPQSHLSKKGTPTMGGFLILVGLVPSVLLWADLGNPYVWIVLFVTLGFGAVGFADDYLKVSKISPQALGTEPGQRKVLQTSP